MIRLATEQDIDTISKIASKSSKEIGFVMKVAMKEAIKKDSLIVYERNRQVVGFCKFNKRKKDGVTVIYEICVLKEFRGLGYGRMMVEYLDRPIELKCPVDNASNKFYKAIGAELVETVPGRKRELNIWRLMNMNEGEKNE